ncbi:MAG: hypothetical protein VKO00_06635 [Cyanobacteriota bacterium]|nr:hypothetical protein [Cyanobacteriota bacterium]
MPWWLDLLVLLLAAGLWASGRDHTDDVWGLLQKLLATVALAVVLLGGRQILLELILLAVALWLPGANSSRLASRRSPGDG